ncbi:DUF2157 domain-containing protein [Halobacillus litoralis]|uniref:DUF2157 domain-containing protein n=1 Tax=Halobacillus litoralis TaxID=45668 RepID=UPI001CD5A4E8|nr:DUF2157 domain-containing protein [Halobacillus litoralis]MCA1022535.1 DUF2157 domain-containing protein [Halobacillus litoralis]
MKRNQLLKESEWWVEEAIITEAQREKLLEHYPEKQNKPVLLTFAALFIGLGFLTFTASNWSYLADWGRMAVLLLSMSAFYVAGERVYKKKSARVGSSLILTALLIFGAAIFLVGQMYHYTAFSASPFLLWSMAAAGLYVVMREGLFYYAAAVIITVGQVYSGLVFQDFYVWLGLLLLGGLGWVVYETRSLPFAGVFAVSYYIQALVLVFSGGYPYYWLIIGSLALYIADDLITQKGQTRIWKTSAVVFMFAVFFLQIFFLGDGYAETLTESSLYFFLIWAVLFVLAVVRSALSTTNYYWIDLLLFIPVFRFPSGDLFSLIVLFIYAVLWLVSGYQQEVRRWVNKGTAAFLLTTLAAYFQLAWDFMDRSVFFFVGGLLLFVLSYGLEKKRRSFRREGEEQ